MLSVTELSSGYVSSLIEKLHSSLSASNVSTACRKRAGADNAKLKMQKAKVKIADSEFYIFNFAFLIDPTRPLPQAVLTRMLHQKCTFGFRFTIAFVHELRSSRQDETRRRPRDSISHRRRRVSTESDSPASTFISSPR
jgi:hypothetical protein